MIQSLRAKYNSTDKKTLFMVGILGLTIALIIGLAAGIPTSQTKDNLNFRIAKKILENNVLIDG